MDNTTTNQVIAPSPSPNQTLIDNQSPQLVAPKKSKKIIIAIITISIVLLVTIGIILVINIHAENERQAKINALTNEIDSLTAKQVEIFYTYGPNEEFYDLSTEISQKTLEKEALEGTLTTEH